MIWQIRYRKMMNEESFFLHQATSWLLQLVTVFAGITDKIPVLSYAVSYPLKLNDKLRSSCASANTPREVNVKSTFTRYVCWIRCEPVRISSKSSSPSLSPSNSLETGTMISKCGRLCVVLFQSSFIDEFDVQHI